MKLLPKLRAIRSRSWTGWPTEAYAQKRYQRRLQAVQEHLVHCLDNAPSGAIRLVSMCAGDGRDVIGVLRTQFTAGPAAEFLPFFTSGTRGFVQERRTPPGAVVRLVRDDDEDAITTIAETEKKVG